MTIPEIQQILCSEGIDLWLMYDFRGSNSIAWQAVGLAPDTHCTRRWAIGIPAEGEPFKLVHAIEHFTLDSFPAEKIIYSGRESWQENLQKIVSSYGVIAMEYSPDNAIPVVSKVDAGTMEFLRRCGANVVSSADMVQKIYAVWNAKQLNENLNYTAPKLRECMTASFGYLQTRIAAGIVVTEFDVQRFILEKFDEFGLITDSHPIVAIAKNAASPHYAPSAEHHAIIPPDELVLIDMWAKTKAQDSTFADITWMCYTGSTVPERYANLFSIVIGGRDAALHLVQERFSAGIPVAGYEVDDAARNYISAKGYGQYFIHRTGHSITTETHGAGANMDNYETQDTRRIIPSTSFSIEPGIYIKDDVGFRSEISVIISPLGEVLVPSAPIQTEIVALG